MNKNSSLTMTRNRFTEAVFYECRMRPHHVRALLKIGKPDFSPMKAAPLFERLEYGWMHRRISPHRSNVLTTPLRLSRVRASVVVYADWIILCAFSSITNTIANGKHRVIGWPYAASKNEKDLLCISV